MTTLITGAGGFVGSHLAEALQRRGEHVDCLIYAKNTNRFLDPSEFSCIRGDITDRKFVKKTVKGYDKIYHLASLLNYSSPTMQDFIKVNVEGTKNIMEAALDSGAKKVIVASSRVTINEDGSGRVDEEHVHQGFFDSAYAMTKYRAEKTAFEYGSRGIKVVTIHPTLIFGPREMHTTGPLFRSYLQQKIRVVGFLDSTFNLIYVKDIVPAIMAAMKKGKPGHRYILGGDDVKIEDLLVLLDEITKTKKPVIRLPNPLIETLISYIGPVLRAVGFKVPVAKEQIYAMKTDTLVDVSKARKELGLKVTPLRKALEETLEWYKENGYVKI